MDPAPPRGTTSGQSPAAPRRGRALCVALVLVLALVLLVLAAGAAARRRYERYLSGFWTGDPGFLEAAQLRDMQLFVGPPSGGRRRGYLLMADLDGNLVANRPLALRERAAGRRGRTALRGALRPAGDACLGAVDVEYEGPGAPPMPPRLKTALSALGGTLTLYDGEKVYAFLVKDHAASAAAVAAYAAPGAP